MQIRYHDPAVMAFVTARRFGKIAAELLGARGVRIYHDQSLFKEPGAGVTNITPWHQDLYYWPFNEGTVCGMWMPLHDITAERGNMRFVKGSHKNGYLGEHHISDESEAAYSQWIADHDAHVVDVVPMHAGESDVPPRLVRARRASQHVGRHARSDGGSVLRRRHARRQGQQLR